MTVYLVGAGPGDPGLLTLRGAELLARADVVVYDRLASPALLARVRADAERIYVGKGPGQAEMTQDDINRVLVDRGSRAFCVVRLKGGDPFVFGRGGEEAEALAAAGVAFEIVPGVTSAIAAPAYAGIPVTHRGLSTSVTIVTGHEDPAKGRSDTDWEALARIDGTLVILMGAAHFPDIASRLLTGGRAPETPVAAVRWGTHPEQHTVRGTLATAGDMAIESPSAIVVGGVAALDLAWFEQRPLFGRRIVVTRAREQASELRVRLEALGAVVIELPSIAVQPVDFVVPDLEPYAWLVFTSANGVDAFFDRGVRDARALGGVQVACIGPGTADALSARGVRADLLPERFIAESLVDAFPVGNGRGRVLLARAEVARDVLPDGLRAKGWDVDVLTVYRTVAATPDPADIELVRSGAVDALTFTSSSTVDNFCDVMGAFAAEQPVAVCIGPVTAKTAEVRGLRVDAVADEHTIDGLVATVVTALSSPG